MFWLKMFEMAIYDPRPEAVIGFWIGLLIGLAMLGCAFYCIFM